MLSLSESPTQGRYPLLSSAAMALPMPHCRRLDILARARALSRAEPSTGSSRPISSAMMLMTTKSSIRVKAAAEG